MQASTEPALAYSAEIDAARRVAFIVSSAEVSLGLTHRELPLLVRLGSILDAAMLAPEAITPIQFQTIYQLMGAGDADQSLAS